MKYITLKEVKTNRRYSQFDIWDVLCLEDKMGGNKLIAFKNLYGRAPNEADRAHYGIDIITEIPQETNYCEKPCHAHLPGGEHTICEECPHKDKVNYCDCGEPNGSADPDLLCKECRETYGHTYQYEL